ncbi:MAG: BMC domain-containing protein [Clostridiales bacterium]|nr:BMC domain-containing protein [Clostridiales bacterium]
MEKQRIIQEFVPGKQITLAHIIAGPSDALYEKLGLNQNGGAIGIMTITPSEGAIVAADIAEKTSSVSIGFIDRFNGALVLTGDVSAVESAVEMIIRTLGQLLGFAPAEITRT